jgi:hypothetical protein
LSAPEWTISLSISAAQLIARFQQTSGIPKEGYLMRKLLSVGALASTTAFLAVLPLAGTSPAAPSSRGLVSTATLTTYSPRQYIFETIDSESDCNSDGQYMFNTGQASAYQCESAGTSVWGVELYNLWLWPEGDGS